MKRSDCILVYGSTTKGDVVKRSDCILVYRNTTKGDIVKRSNCIYTLCACIHYAVLTYVHKLLLISIIISVRSVWDVYHILELCIRDRSDLPDTEKYIHP